MRPSATLAALLEALRAKAVLATATALYALVAVAAPAATAFALSVTARGLALAAAVTVLTLARDDAARLLPVVLLAAVIAHGDSALLFAAAP
jgi:hypothetical protein